ncbi:universal stress protein [Gracilibacillus alcaliphilus]|uniref:universal stress protein n=1 Tax=Gracilibacillus alcaliphilus TaxID=1401441 RepID=UPI00195C5D4A|nr:universal stress protein [Gracilibacillus alcaliphilus]MBM7678189.1 nucleotide-binding universal stress UspA family protein [Gracilibacillus alcaliphilus]
MYKKVLLAADGSDHSIRAASHAVQIAKIANGKIDIIFAIDDKTSKEEVLHNVDSHMIKQEREQKLAPVVDILEENQLAYQMHIIHGDPGPEIVRFANQHEYDIVIIGSRGLNQFQTMILGSVSHKVAKRVQCPVLIVK